MTEPNRDLQRLSADSLMTGYSRTKVFVAALLAVLLHVVLLGATSGRYIYDRWIDPEGAAAREAAQTASSSEPAEAAPGNDAAAQPQGKQPAEAPKAGADAAKDPTIQQKMQQNPALKGETEVLTPPKVSDPGAGFTLEQTN